MFRNIGDYYVNIEKQLSIGGNRAKISFKGYGKKHLNVVNLQSISVISERSATYIKDLPFDSADYHFGHDSKVNFSGQKVQNYNLNIYIPSEYRDYIIELFENDKIKDINFIIEEVEYSLEKDNNEFQDEVINILTEILIYIKKEN